MRVLERGWLSSNNIVFIGRDSTALVDSGYASHADQTVALVERALDHRPLDQLLNTHLHSDHCGGNAAIQARWSCTTSIPAADAQSIRDWREEDLNAVLTGQRLARFHFEGTLSAGEVLRLGDLDWQVLAAGGHDPHSIILYCESEAILISADALWEQGFGVIFPELLGEEGFAATRTTLRSIEALDVRLVIPGHGAAFADCAGALARAFARLDYLSADPRRNAGHAIKVLLKFMLLECQVMTRADIVARFLAAPLVTETNRRHLQMPGEELVDWTIKELVRLNAARRDGERVVNVG
jgi:glyoxylase-like metal-dependent hydrolase (beta-lactamase superfamily II)